MATDDEQVQKRVLDELGTMLRHLSLGSTPPEIGRLIYRMVKETTGNPDPFRVLKRESTQHALALYPSLKKTIIESENSLLTAIRIAIAGNVIDLGVSGSFDLDAAVRDALMMDFAICDYAAFEKYLTESRQILYIGDNAGETVFDRLLIEQMNKPVTYVVREEPVINDATAEDAVQAGIDKIATIVSSGTDAPGTIPGTCSLEFRELLDSAEFVLAKGQGNYEGLSDDNRPLFFLLKAKCRLIANDLGVTVGDIVLKGIHT